MDKNSPEYLKFKANYEAKEKYKEEHAEEYPWWAYFQFGWHHMTNMSDEEVKSAVKFYHLRESRTEDGRKTFERTGRQPIYIVQRRKEK